MILGRLSLDRTLGCGQVFRWRKERGWWKGILADRVVKLRQQGTGIEVIGEIPERTLGARIHSSIEGVVTRCDQEVVIEKA